MADDLSAPQTSAAEPVASTDAAPSTGADSKPAAEPKASLRETLAEAMKTVKSRAPNETDKAASVLKDGAGADDASEAEHSRAVEKAQAALDAAKEASERGKKSWETRRANAEKAKEAAAAEEAASKTADKQAETIGKAVAEAVKPAEATAETAKATPSETKFKEPPQRFTPQAKAEWDKVPETVRAEIDRSLRETQQGIEKYKADAEKWTPLAEYDRLSQEAYKQPLADTLKNYVELDRGLANPETQLATLERLVSGMQYVAEDGKTYNWDMRQLAEHILAQTEQGVSTFQDPVADIRRELADVRKQLAEAQQSQTQRQQAEVQQRTQTVEQQIQKFATENTRFDELFPDIEVLLASPKFPRTGDPVADLKLAYEKAERLNPAPSLSPPAPALPAQDTAAQTRKGQASVTGAPAAGSNPAGRRPVPTSSREALKAAFAAKGLSL